MNGSVLAAAAPMTFKQSAPVDFIMTSLPYIFGVVYFPIALPPPALYVTDRAVYAAKVDGTLRPDTRDGS